MSNEITECRVLREAELVAAEEPADCCGCTPSAPCDEECDGQLIDDGSALTHCTRCQRDLEQMIAEETH